MATRIPVTTFYTAALWVVLIGDPATGAISMALFGLGRGLPLIWMAWQIESGEERLRLTEVLHRLKLVVHVVNGLALSCVGSGLIIAGFISR